MGTQKNLLNLPEIELIKRIREELGHAKRPALLTCEKETIQKDIDRAFDLSKWFLQLVF